MEDDATMQMQAYPSICWFCGQERQSDGCAITVNMRKKLLEARGAPLTRTWWELQKIYVPRCQICVEEEKLQKKIEKRFWIIAVVVGLILVALMDIVPDPTGNGPVAIIAAYVGGPSFFLGLYAVIYLQKKVGRGIKKQPKLDYPAIRELLNAGWKEER